MRLLKKREIVPTIYMKLIFHDGSKHIQNIEVPEIGFLGFLSISLGLRGIHNTNHHTKHGSCG